jgi:ribosome biogenesis GTPase / thiamine phosphate phosphatase
MRYNTQVLLDDKWQDVGMGKKKKVRVDFRKNRSKPARDRQWTRGFQDHGFHEEATPAQERVRAKGDLSRRRTILQEEIPAGAEGVGAAEMPAVSTEGCLAGRVLRVHRLMSIVETEDGRQYRCAVRRLLRTLATHERSLVTTGDCVWFRPYQSTPANTDAERANTADLDGMIERVEPRHGILTRASRGREQVLVANVDQVVIVMSLVEPELKPHLVDRYLASAGQGGIAPLLCLNKADLVEPAAYQEMIGFYSQLGVPTFLTSAKSGLGIDQLRQRLKSRQTVFAGQSGVGKSSLLNAIQPDLGLRVREVSDVNQKGKHTTTHAELIRLDFGGWVVDTPGVRQFELWDLAPAEVEGYFPEFRPFVPLCGYPDCTHTHEDRCAVKRAVHRRQITAARYTSYLGFFE